MRSPLLFILIKKRGLMECNLITNKFPEESLQSDGKIYGKVEVVDGKAKLTNGKLIPRQPVDFIITEDNCLLIGKRHATLSKGKDVKAAGNLTIKRGKIRRIDNLSGHFRPTVEEGLKFPELLKKQGFDVSGANLRLYEFDTNAKGYVNNISTAVNTYLS